jgi:hypothetical protein
MYTHEFQFKNGDLVRDKITKFSGTVTGSVFYLTGCNQYLITPSCEKEFKKPDAHWFDEGRLEIVETEKVKSKDVQGDNNGPDLCAPGGKREY